MKKTNPHLISKIVKYFCISLVLLMVISCSGGDVPAPTFNLKVQTLQWVDNPSQSKAVPEWRCVPEGNRCAKAYCPPMHGNCPGYLFNRSEAPLFFFHYSNKTISQYFQASNEPAYSSLFPGITTRQDVIDNLRNGSYDIHISNDTTFLSIFHGADYNNIDNIVLAFEYEKR